MTQKNQEPNYQYIQEEAQRRDIELRTPILDMEYDEIIPYLELTLGELEVTDDDLDPFSEEGYINSLLISSIKAELGMYKRTPQGPSKGHWSPY